ncbi:MAG: PilN domain-containing protein [bacterium]|nr:PilN domain-containing protein [bacterium]
MAARGINLLFKEGFQHTTSGRVLTWAISAGRVIVILTEVVVISAFLSRFWLDRTLTNLNEDNAAKKAQVELSQNFENDFREAQTRLVAYKIISTKNFTASGAVEEMSQYLPEDIVLTSIAVNAENVEIKGKAFTDGGLAILLKGVNDSPNYKNVGLADITVTSGDSSFGFVLRGDKEKEAKSGTRK